jgi:putative peptidoglycan lipid II flippase
MTTDNTAVIDDKSKRQADGSENTAQRNRRMALSSLIVAGSYTLAKVISLVQVVLIADRIGLQETWDAYSVADQFSGTLFTLVSGGALTHALIPILSGYFGVDNRSAAWRTASNIANTVLLSALVLAAAGMIFAVPIAERLAPGFTPSNLLLTAELLRILLVSVVILAISGVVMGILQSDNHFLTPAIASVMLDIGLLFGVFVLLPIFGIHGVAYGAVLGTALHLAIQVPVLWRKGVQWRPELGWNSNPDVLLVVRLMIPRVLGVLTFMFSLQFANNVASRMGEGAVGAFGWGWRLMQIPETIIGTAIGTVVFPTLAMLAYRQDQDGKRDAMAAAVRYILALTIPAAVGLVLVGPTALKLLERGAFTADDSALIFSTLQFFAIGLVAHSLLEVVARSFYAEKDTLTPMYLAFGGLAVNIVLSLWLTGLSPAAFISPQAGVTLPINTLQYLALANSAATVAQVGVLMYLLHRRWQGIQANSMFVTMLKTLAASASMIPVVWAINSAWVGAGLGGGLVLTVVQIGVEVLAGGAVFLVLALLVLRIEEVQTLWRAVGPLVAQLWARLRAFLLRKRATPQ